MKTIDTLSSIEGRALLHDIFHELRYEKQLSSFSALSQCWRICTNENELYKYVSKEVTVAHKLGIFSGSALWMEEIVNRFYFSTINSFVYFGAAVLLVLIGIRRFSDQVSDTVVIAGVAFEALMLIFMFIVMFFSPNETELTRGSDEESAAEEIIMEIGEIGRDFAAVAVQLEMMGESIKELIRKQEDLVNSVNNVVSITAQAISPNPEMLETMRETNSALSELKNTVKDLNKSSEMLRKEEIEFAVRKEVERILVDKLIKKDEV